MEDYLEEMSSKPTNTFIETPGPDLDFDALNDQSKKIDFNYDRQITENIDNQSRTNPSEIYKKFSLLEKNLKKYPQRPLKTDETTKSKYERLKKELIDVKKEIDFVNQKEKEINPKQNLSYLNEINFIENELKTIAEKKGISELFDIQIDNGFCLENNLALFKREIQNKIAERIKRKIENLSEDKSISNIEQNENKFQIFLNKETESIHQMIKLQEYERKIKKLELLVGITKDLETNIITKIQNIYKLAECLNISKLDSLAINIQNINVELDLLIEKNKKFNLSPEEIEKINNLNEKFKKTQISMEELPNLIEKMQSLSNIHEESASLILTTNNLKSIQQHILNSLTENDEILSTLEINFENNMTIMNKNIELLKEKANKSKKKIN